MGFLTRKISPSEKTHKYWSFRMQIFWTKNCWTMLMDWFSQLTHESSYGMCWSCYFWSTQLFSFLSKLRLMHSIPHQCSCLTFLSMHFSCQMSLLVSFLSSRMKEAIISHRDLKLQLITAKDGFSSTFSLLFLSKLQRNFQSNQELKLQSEEIPRSWDFLGFLDYTSL